MSMVLFETTGGVFDAVSSPGAATNPVGTGLRAYQGCGNATLDYVFTAGSNAGLSGSTALTRIGPTPAACVG
jgi:hypothetical protein